MHAHTQADLHTPKHAYAKVCNDNKIKYRDTNIAICFQKHGYIDIVTHFLTVSRYRQGYYYRYRGRYIPISNCIKPLY